MRTILLMAIVPLALAGCASPGAENHDHAAAGGPGGKGGGQMAMMQERMLGMHEQMHRIMDARDPAERERLMREHREMMRDQMKMMHGSGGGMMGAPATK